MDNLTLLKMLIQEEKYPCFTDDQLNAYLALNNNDVNKTASKLCLLKADNEKSIKVGPIEIENADPEYWQHLSEMYANDSERAASSIGPNGYYKNSMRRADEL